MLVPLIDEGNHSVSAKVIEPAAEEREFLRGEVFDRRRKVQLAVKPRLDGVLIGRRDIQRMICHQ